MMKRASFLITLLAVFPLTACSSTGSSNAPSLAKRPYEGRFDVPAQAVPVAPPGPLSTAQSQFSAERDVAARLVSAAGNAAPASESWVVAQQAISRLIAARAPLTEAAAEMDRLYISRSADEEFAGLPEIFALRERMMEADSAQMAILEALNASLR
jgi:hypothetical protein